jgi:hypothetical protein
MTTLRILTVTALVLGAVLGDATYSDAAGTTLTVPGDYPTIQAAVNAAHRGDSIRVGAGVFSEQVSIGKDLTLIGAGATRTTIRAPKVLVKGSLDRASIVDIHSGATVRVTDLGVSGPGPNACGSGPSLNAGIRVSGGATLDLRSARVTDIVDTPVHDCSHNGTGIGVGGIFTGSVGHATIRDVVVIHYQNSAITAFEPGTTLTVTDSFLDARIDVGAAVFTGGVDFGNGAVVRVLRNVIRGNRCTSPTFNCGPDPINQFQASGVGNGPGDQAAGSEIAYNILSENEIGVYLFAATGCCSVHHNLIRNSRFFGIAIQNGTNLVSNDVIEGGSVGVAAIADFVDTVAILDHEVIRNTSVARTKTIECCGFHATIKEIR